MSGGVPKQHEGSGGDQVTLGARPEHISISDEGALRGQVFAVEYMGPRQVITVDTGAGRLKVRTSNQVTVQRGENIGLNFRSERMVLFNSAHGQALKSDLITDELVGGGNDG